MLILARKNRFAKEYVFDDVEACVDSNEFTNGLIDKL